MVRKTSSKAKATKDHLHVQVVLTSPAKASALGRKAAGVFEAGVTLALRNAKARGIAVTVIGPDGRLVRGIPEGKSGSYVVADADSVSPLNHSRIANVSERSRQS